MQYDKADQQNCPRRVVFYGRVSTELEAQISALKNQMNWYRWTEIHLGTKSISRVMHCSMQCARNVQLPFDFGGKNHAGKNKSEERGWGRQ